MHAFLLPPLHAGQRADFPGGWRLDLPLLVILTTTLFLYAFAFNRVRTRSGRPLPAHSADAFAAGIVATAVALMGPLDTFNDELFSVHMLQHVVLMFVAAPLLLLGRPLTLALRALPPQTTGRITRATLGHSSVRTVLRVLVHPIVLFLLFNGNLLLWHWPRFYDAALENVWLHELEHLLFFGTALLFWFPLIERMPAAFRISPHGKLLLLFATGSVNDLLGLTLLFSVGNLYPYYESASNPWNISPAADQKIAGLIMLIAGTVITFGAIFALLSREANRSLRSRINDSQHVAGN